MTRTRASEPDWAAIEGAMVGRLDLEQVCGILGVDRAGWYRIPPLASLAQTLAMQVLASELRHRAGFLSVEACWREAGERLGIDAETHERQLRRWSARAKGDITAHGKSPAGIEPAS